jgi:hypothetical protein
MKTILLTNAEKKNDDDKDKEDDVKTTVFIPKSILRAVKHCNRR